MVNHQREIIGLLQLASPMLPVGGYTYSDGLETLINMGIVKDRISLHNWLETELKQGAIMVETAVVRRIYGNLLNNNIQGVIYWNNWLSATRETKELREQSWQMGGSLIKLLKELITTDELHSNLGKINPPYNYATAYGIAGYYWSISEDLVIVSYLQSWLSNLVNAGVKLIPLGQTDGQRILFNLALNIRETSLKTKDLTDDQLYCCSWGLSMASMHHETLYSRLFRS